MNSPSPNPIGELLATQLPEVQCTNAHRTKQFADFRKAGHLIKIITTACILMAALSTGVLASSPQTSTIYYACVTKKTGTIKIVSPSFTCPTSSYKIQWDQTGPQGPQGPQGPSDSYTAVLKSDLILPPAPVSVVTLSGLPSGNYTVIASASISYNGSQRVGFECSLSPDTNTPVPVVDGGLINGLGESLPMSINDSLSNFAGGSISLTCMTLGAAGTSTVITSAHAQITALQVGTVTHN